MSTTESVFGNRRAAPSARGLAAGLGGRVALWEALVVSAEKACGPLARAWSCYTKKTGWILLLKRDTKTICSLIPRAKDFEVIFLLPERAVAAARSVRLPKRVRDAMEAAKVYPVGRAFRVRVTKPADLPAVTKLAGIKAESFRR